MAFPESLVRGFLLSCCLAQSNVPAFRTIDRGAQSNIESPRQAVALTAAEWDALWKAHSGPGRRGSGSGAPPHIDFDRETVVAVFMGSRPTGGFSVAIVSATERDETLVVAYNETSPQPGAIAAQVLTSPYHIVAVPKHTGPVTFEKR
jgi:hypothetical protein